MRSNLLLQVAWNSFVPGSLDLFRLLVSFDEVVCLQAASRSNGCLRGASERSCSGSHDCVVQNVRVASVRASKEEEEETREAV